MTTATGPRLVPSSPETIGIRDVVVLPRMVHQDPRGLLVETLRADDASVEGAHFRMTYTSVTLPGEYRDRDRWHVHSRQTDRFVVTLGEMILALHDGRRDSPTYGRLEVVRMAGPEFGKAGHSERRDLPTHLVSIPPEVHHCVGNLSDAPFVLQNFPTQYYDPTDEGRVPFASLRIPSVQGPFSWDEVQRSSRVGTTPP